MDVPEQRLDDREVHSGLGQRGPERVPQRMRVGGRNPRLGAVVTEDRAQPGRGQRLTPVAALGDHEQHRRVGDGPFDQQIRLHPADYVSIDRRLSFPTAFAGHPRPALGDVHIGHSKTQYLARAQPGEQHQPGDRSIPPRPQAGQERGYLDAIESAGQSSWLPHPQRRPGLRTGQVPQQPLLLRSGGSAGGRAFRHWVGRRRVPHRPEREQPADRRQPSVGRGWRQPVAATAGQESQQRVGVHRLESHVVLGQPAGERQQVERVRAPRPWCVVAIGEIAEVVVAQPQILRPARRAAQHPAAIVLLDPQFARHSHETRISAATE